MKKGDGEDDIYEYDAGNDCAEDYNDDAGGNDDNW